MEWQTEVARRQNDENSIGKDDDHDKHYETPNWVNITFVKFSCFDQKWGKPVFSSSTGAVLVVVVVLF